MPAREGVMSLYLNPSLPAFPASLAKQLDQICKLEEAKNGHAINDRIAESAENSQ
jgi:hypothetical protein